MNDTDEQRKFLHDLANPLAVVHGNLRITLDRLTKDGLIQPDDAYYKRLEKAMKACQEMNDKLIERRTIIKSRIQGTPAA